MNFSAPKEKKYTLFQGIKYIIESSTSCLNIFHRILIKYNHFCMRIRNYKIIEIINLISGCLFKFER